MLSKRLERDSMKKLIVKRLTVYVDPEIDERLREKAVREDRPLSTIAERAFRRDLRMPLMKGRKG